MKNILHLIHSDEPGGAESVLLALIEGLERHGFHSTVGLAGGGWLLERLEERGADVIPLRFRHTGDWGLVREIRCAVSHCRADVVHTHLSRMNLYGGIAASLSRTPVVATLHGKDFSGRWGKVAERLIARFSNRIAAVSQDLANTLERRGWPSNRIRVIYNGIEPVSPEIEISRKEARREFGLEPWMPVIGTVGRLEPVKAYPVLLAAAEKVLTIEPEARILFIGDGSQREALEKEARDLGISNRVIFAGTRQDARRLLTAMDVFVLCSYSEGLSISLLEAMSARLPVIATEVGGNPEVVEYGSTGLLIPQSDPEMLAAAMLFLINYPVAACKLGQMAGKRIAERFSLETMVTGYAELYEELSDPSGKVPKSISGAGFSCGSGS